ncbi:MAG: chorismate synthase [Ruminococcus flavefaciens]|nr:chorismate synthase [Ruminococcus flavefaciens]MCM1229560.1 chorismate synthase [Ruminococcus flavefaciens]
MSLIWNNKISVSYFGEPQDSVIGINIDNLPSGEYIDPEALSRFMNRLYPKSMGRKNPLPSPRIISGLRNEHTTGSPLCALIQNTAVAKDKKPDTTLRYGHADYTGTVRYRGIEDAERYSAYTEHFIAPLCFAGAVAGQILERRGIYTGSHIASVHNIKDNPFDPVNITRDAVLSVRFKDFPVINDRRGWLMLEDIAKAGEAGESLGGIVECAVVNLPAGVGSPVFDGLKNNIAQLVFGIPEISGLEFGSGFSSAKTTGSQHSDRFYMNEQGYTLTATNNHGGIIGGVSSGMPITLNVAFSPSASSTCFVPTAVPCVESAVNIAILSNMIDYPNFCLR